MINYLLIISYKSETHLQAIVLIHSELCITVHVPAMDKKQLGFVSPVLSHESQTTLIAVRRKGRERVEGLNVMR